ncbi:hypothetical protein [Nocardia sp. NPDC005366]|uniref:hypothetical protein n=1 Tax=Nocardia sp. NPDC005366 TaxID=3156878 RepID=UPI0033B888E0
MNGGNEAERNAASGGWVEVRIHGVSGTPPEATLRSWHAVQVAGDDKGRIYHVTGDGSASDANDSSAPLIEAYHWGSYTAGSWVQGLWFVLIPFGILNAAQFMLPRPAIDDRFGYALHAVCGAMLRLVSLCMTGVFAFTSAYILADLLAWQTLPTWIAGIGTATVPIVSVPAHEFAVAVALLAAVALIWLISTLAGRGVSRVETTAELDSPDTVGQTLLQRPGFLAGDHKSPVLRNLHLAFATLIVAFMGAGLFDQYRLLDVVTKYGLVALVIIVVLLGDPERSAALTDGTPPPAEALWKVIRWLARLILAGACLLVVASCVGLVRTDTPVAEQHRMVQFDSGATVLLSYSLIGLLILLVATVLLAVRTWSDQAKTPSSFRPYARGTAAYWVTSTGFFLGLGFSAAVAEGSAQLLGATYKSPILEHIANAWGITVVLAVGVMVVVAVLFRIRSGSRGRHVDEMYSDLEDDLGISQRWKNKAAAAIGIARLKNCLVPISILFGIVALLLTVAVAHEVVGLQHFWRHLLSLAADTDGQLPTLLRWAGADVAPGQFDPVIWLGTWVLVAVAGRLVLLGRSAVTGQESRRTVNTVWDVFCFWPHAAHPFAPPPYSTYVVIDIRDRITYHLERLKREGRADIRRPIVVCGHSQGSLIAFAALLWLEPEQRQYVSLLTFGSQLQVIFPRAFPGYINFATIAAVFGELDGGWVNLYRETDPLAGPVLSWKPDLPPKREPIGLGDIGRAALEGPILDTGIDAVYGRREFGNDWRLLDPTPADRARQTRQVSKVNGHSDFFADPAWDRAVARARGVDG